LEINYHTDKNLHTDTISLSKIGKTGYLGTQELTFKQQKIDSLSNNGKNETQIAIWVFKKIHLNHKKLLHLNQNSHLGIQEMTFKQQKIVSLFQ